MNPENSDYEVTEIFPLFAIDDWELETVEEMKEVTSCLCLHLDDCDCNFCETNRGSIIPSSTVFVEIKSPYGMKTLRLTFEEALNVAEELIRFCEKGKETLGTDSVNDSV